MRIRIDLSYDGTDFKGWALQPGLRTVQEETERALAVALRLPEARVTCAGRTDAGVHARGQVLHLDVDDEAITRSAGRSQDPPLDALARRVNGILPLDVRVRRASLAPPGFDARYSAIWRRYTYRVADSPELVDPLLRSHVLVWSRRLDIDKMNRAAEQLVGFHDFASFCRAREGATTIRTLLDLHWSRSEHGLAELTVRADAFCHNMVRSLTGCLIAIGDGRRPVSWASEIMEALRRDSSLTVMQAHGLTLEEVGYPDGIELVRQAERARNKRELTKEPADG
ncbi:tRNA pseudouridine38-40 synthase [Nocardioides daedukensis]|uniref:tRNA pseudouridine synthase A n=1 Tax=Nocardioides daedukensis TaxID=634462 RepID=A0A7Y9UPY5_9ACTN|nr:tRNA pseudouridine38-40 synthase [Nocardioides daedukensis]